MRRKHPTLAGSAILAALFAGFASCSGFVAEIIAGRIVERMNRTDHFQAELRTFGKESTRVRFFYRKLWHIHQEVLEPPEAKGELFLFDGERFVFHSPVRHVAFLITGIHEPTTEEWKTFMRERMAHSGETATFGKVGKGSILGRETSIYRSAPKGGGSLLPLATDTWVDEETSLPLKVVSARQDGSILRGFEHTRIDFESPLPPEAFEPRLVPQTEVIRWDFGERGAAEPPAPEGFVRPEELPGGLFRGKWLESPDAGGAWLALYENRPFFLILGEWRDGAVPLPFSGGVEVPIGGRIRTLLYYSGLHLVHFEMDGRRVFLFSNLTLNEILGIRWSSGRTGAGPPATGRAS